MSHAALLGYDSGCFLAADLSDIFICHGATCCFPTRSLEENLHKPVKIIQLRGERRQKLKSPVFSIFGRGILEMMKGSLLR